MEPSPARSDGSGISPADWLSSWLTGFGRTLIEYETPRLVKVHNVWLGVVIRLCQIGVIAYVISYAIIFERGYQEFASVESSVTVKVKGTSRSHMDANESALAAELPAPWRALYNRVWDVADYVVPPAENGAFFITTNVVLTPNQTQGECPEDKGVKRAECKTDKDCKKDEYLIFGHGPMTGRCVTSDRGPFQTCEIETWCPVERDGLPLGRKRPLMDRVDKYTVFIKNSIAYPHFGKQYRRNNVIPGPKPTIYNETHRPLGQIFWLGDIVRMAGGNFTHLSIKGGVISVSIQWRCNLDWDFMENCLPEYEFRILDTGWNFRHAHFHENGRRTLIKAYGLRFVITVDGTAGKFSIRNTVLNVGNGLALLGMATLIGEFFLLYFAKEKKSVADLKYDYLFEERRESSHSLSMLRSNKKKKKKAKKVLAANNPVCYEEVLSCNMELMAPQPTSHMS